jgi:hypothetical protein
MLNQGDAGIKAARGSVTQQNLLIHQRIGPGISHHQGAAMGRDLCSPRMAARTASGHMPAGGFPLPQRIQEADRGLGRLAHLCSESNQIGNSLIVGGI